jgi:glutamine cyclotransferase
MLFHGATGPIEDADRHVRTGPGRTVRAASCLLVGVIAVVGASCGDDDRAADTATSLAAPATSGATAVDPAATGVTDVTDASTVPPEAVTPETPGTTGPVDPSAVDAPCSVAYEVLAELPHDRLAFTQGLVVDGDVLHESTGLYGESTVRTVDPATGDVLRETSLPDDHFGEGLALLGDELFQLTWREGVVHVYDRELERLRTISTSGEGWGLTTDGDELVLSDGSPVLSWIDPDSWTTTRTVLVTEAGQPVPELNELELVDGAVLANVWRQPVVAVVDPADGTVTGWLDLTALLPDPSALDDPSNDVLNGIALDPATGHLFVTGKRWPVMYELDVDRACWPAGTGATP